MVEDNSRTLSSEGGIKKANGIEVSAIDEKIIPVELDDFIYSLRQLEKLKWIEKVDISIVKLPLGRKISYLNNGLDRRRCLIAEIIKTNGDIFCIIEVERQGKLLSTLIIKGESKEQLKRAYEELLNGLVRESGKWSIKVINNLEERNISIYRNKHINTKIKIKNLLKKLE